MSQSCVLSPTIVLIVFKCSSISRWLNIVSCGTASKRASKISGVTAPASPPLLLATSRVCGLRALTAGVRFTKRLASRTVWPTLSSSSVLLTAELRADGNRRPFIFASSNFSSSMAILEGGTSLRRRSILNLSPARFDTIDPNDHVLELGMDIILL